MQVLPKILALCYPFFFFVLDSVSESPLKHVLWYQVLFFLGWSFQKYLSVSFDLSQILRQSQCSEWWLKSKFRLKFFENSHPGLFPLILRHLSHMKDQCVQPMRHIWHLDPYRQYTVVFWALLWSRGKCDRTGTSNQTCDTRCVVIPAGNCAARKSRQASVV